MAKTRLAKLEGMEKYLEKENCYLGEHPGVSVTKALDVARERLKKLKLETWVQIKEEGLKQLATICSVEVQVKGQKAHCQKIFSRCQ